jgi:hypothetical protein
VLHGVFGCARYVGRVEGLEQSVVPPLRKGFRVWVLITPLLLLLVLSRARSDLPRSLCFLSTVAVRPPLAFELGRICFGAVL